MDTDYCPDCRHYTETITDRSSGDSICAACGLILGDHYINDTPEWRSFAEDTNDNDPHRVGGPQNPFLNPGENLTTEIGRTPKSKSNKGGFSSSIRKFESNSNKTLLSNLALIATMTDRLGLFETIKNRACQIYKEADDRKCCRGRKLDSVLAACIHIACREEKLSRTFKEIGEGANGVSAKEILKSEKIIEAELGINLASGQNAVELVRRYCSSLGLGNQAVKAVQEAYRKSESMDIRRNPQSILATIIYEVSQLTDGKNTATEVAMVTGVAEGTIKKCLKDLRSDISRLIPTWLFNPHEGACGYGDLFQQGYGLETAALSTELFNNGLTCGSCFEIICKDSKWCKPNAGSIKITATNFCPPRFPATFDAWCNSPQKHFDLSMKMFLNIAQYEGGIIPVQYRRVMCSKPGGVKFQISGNPYWFVVLPYNVAGPGSVQLIKIKGSNTGWMEMSRNWGQNWQTGADLVGQSVSLQVTTTDGRTRRFYDVVPADWQFGSTYEGQGNF